MKNVFQSISGSRPQSSIFDLSHTRKFSMKPGFLYPVLGRPAIPSDSWSYDGNAVVRMAPMLSPIMHMVDVCMHSFFYPERLTQRRGLFEVFITGGKNGDGKDAQGFTIEAPYFFVHGGAAPSSPASFNLELNLGVGSLADYLGFQFARDSSLGTTPVKINARLFIAFWRIYNEYFRDQNLDVDVCEKFSGIFDSQGGDITAAIYEAYDTGSFSFFALPRVRWEKDYFTSALPFAQRGEAVEAPLSGTGTVAYKPISEIKDSVGDPPFADGPLETTGGVLAMPGSVGLESGRIENIESVSLTAGGFTITALRTAARLQEWLEKMAVGGARYIEQMRSIFGVTSSDARLQRAEYLGGGKIPMHISEVLQTSADDGTPLAEMAGHGVTAGQVTGFKKFCEEHGFFLTFIFLRPKTAYQEGLPRHFTERFDKLDYPWPQFARIGEQEVLQKEIYFRAEPASDNVVFGYQQRYADEKYIPSTVHGEFRTTLDHWHWGRIFDTDPTLSPGFVSCIPSNRIFNVLSEGTDQLYCIVNNRITARRPLPYYGEPYL